MQNDKCEGCNGSWGSSSSLCRNEEGSERPTRSSDVYEIELAEYVQLDASCDFVRRFILQLSVAFAIAPRAFEGKDYGALEAKEQAV